MFPSWISHLTQYLLLCPLLALTVSSCNSLESPSTYSINGQVINSFGSGIEGIRVYYNASDFVLTDEQGNWTISGLSGSNTIEAVDSGYTFTPREFQVEEPNRAFTFQADRIASETERLVFNWFNQLQMSNGLLESTEGSNIVSLYDNALAAMVFMLNGRYTQAERIFDFFEDRIDTELLAGNGGFSQFRDRNGNPNNHRWMGDNAWLLIALNNYKALTNRTKYDALTSGIADWLISLQDSDGGLFAGYAVDNSRLNFKVTEGNIDAFNAIEGYTSFHSDLLEFLENDRWDATDQNLVAWVGNPRFLYALDLHSWGFAIFEDYPVSSLSSAQRFLNTQVATVTNEQITGYCFDEDQDAVWIEGTGQMALAFHLADMENEGDLYLEEMEKVLIHSVNFVNASSFPYASNLGTTYGGDVLWEGADTNPAISGAAWYLFARYGFNPFAVQRDKDIPEEDKFWVN